MPSLPPSRHLWPAPLRRGLAMLLVWAVVWLNWLAASPAAHHGLHEDCDAPDHQCAVTHWSQGQGIDWSEPTFVLSPIWTAETCVAQALQTEGAAIGGWHWAQGPPRQRLAS